MIAPRLNRKIIESVLLFVTLSAGAFSPLNVWPAEDAREPYEPSIQMGSQLADQKENAKSGANEEEDKNKKDKETLILILLFVPAALLLALPYYRVRQCRKDDDNCR